LLCGSRRLPRSDSGLMPAVPKAMGDDAVNAAPPPQESFEAKRIVKP
jgi:hypothetical protein